MTPPKPYPCFCPVCGCPGMIWQRTGNSIGAELCTDGQYAGGMIPDEHALLIHPGCQHYIWHDEVVYELPKTLKLKGVKAGELGEQACSPHLAYLDLQEMLKTWNEDIKLDDFMQEYLTNNFFGTLDFSLELAPISGSDAWEKAWKLGVAGEDHERQCFLLRRWWWSINHVQGSWDDETDEFIQPPPLDNDALTRCLQTFLPLLTKPEHQLDRTEALRELGDFKEADV